MPNLAELPLMPGFEAPVAHTPEAAPKASQGFYGDWSNTPAAASERAYIENCTCAACAQAQQQERAGMEAVTYATGRIVDGMLQPAVWVVPPLGAALSTGRIRGMYTASAVAGSCMTGRVRWLDPDTGRVYESRTSENSLNQLELRDGRWQSGSGLLWAPCAPDTPIGMEGYIRGVYGQGHVESLQGQVRWRCPGTLDVHDESGRRQWTYTGENPDGSLHDQFGRMWTPSEV